MTMQALLAANGLPHENFTWVGQRLRLHPGAKPSSGTNFNNAPSEGYRWIEVNLSTQMLTAWQGDVAVMQTNISSGVAATPTVTGRFRVGTKLTSQRMVGPGYDLPGVPWVMYFYGAYAIHGAYWHNNFGMPMSHGCVNMRPGEAQMLYNWAPAGTEVYVHY
jgi:lipoprotein-anchoring transpeptidase ErfK/SrfK